MAACSLFPPDRTRPPGTIASGAQGRLDLSSGSSGYQDPLFDRDHASRWGTTLSEPAYSPGTPGRVYVPDVVVVELGVNDLRHGASPTEVEGSMRRTVAELREAAPGIAVS